MKRRQLLQAVAAGWMADACLPTAPHIRGRIVGASHRLGHLLRTGHHRTGQNNGADGPAETADVVVVGSGISGASAAWRLASLGVRVTMLELEPWPGGTSSWGEDGHSPHPWGAHYLPLPERDARTVQRLLRELDIITGWDAAGRPLVRAEMLCHAPEERLYFRGAWHTGLVPYGALSSHERREIDRFRAIQLQLMNRVGNDGRPAFALPIEFSSRDPELLALDKLSMAQWLANHGFRSQYLHWYVEYATRDDFGADLHDVSAWAGLHYFAARRTETEQTKGSRYLVWPEGNGYLARALLERMHGEIRHGALVTSVATGRKAGVRVSYRQVSAGTLHHIDARAVVLAVPAFILRHMLRGSLSEGVMGQLPVRTSSPWLVANLHVTQPPRPNQAWDSMIYQSRGLGYVDAGHQRTLKQTHTVLTYFRAFGASDVAATRRMLLRQSWETLASDVLDDLVTADPQLNEQCERLDVMLWGHAMPRPRPGFIGEGPFDVPLLLHDAVAWAHVDQSGLALFEEANLHGVRAAEAVARQLGVHLAGSWV